MLSPELCSKLIYILILVVNIASVEVHSKNKINRYSGYRSTRSVPQKIDPMLIFASEHEIVMYNLSNKTRATIYSSKHIPYGLGFDVSSNIMYWINNDVGQRAFLKMDMKKHNAPAEILLDKGADWPIALAIDWITGNLYHIESSHGQKSFPHIGSCNVERRFCVVVLHEDLDTPRGLALHPNKGLLFYTDMGPFPHIMRCEMDGSKCKKIINSNIIMPYSPVVDQKNSQICFTDIHYSSYKIECCNFEGLQRRTIPSSGKPYKVTLLGDLIYWSDLRSMNIYSSNIIDGSDKKIIAENLSHHVLYSFIAVNTSIQAVLRENSCLQANCSHFCTLGVDDSFKCFCPLGMTLHQNETCTRCEDSPPCLTSECKLNCNGTLLPIVPYTQKCSPGWQIAVDGSRSCEDVNECNIPDKNDCHHYCVNNIGSYRCECHSSFNIKADEKTCSAKGMLPLFVFLENSKIRVSDWESRSVFGVETLGKDVTSLDVNSEEEIIYWVNSFEGIIGKTQIGDNSTAEILWKALPQPHLIAYDWVSKNIYFIGSSFYGETRKSFLMACSLGASRACAILYELGDVNVTTIKLVPEAGILFWAEVIDGTSTIRKGFLDGSGAIDCVVDQLDQTGIAVDHVTGLLYWLDPHSNLKGVNFNCTTSTINGRVLLKSNQDFNDLEVYENVFIINNGRDKMECQTNNPARCTYTNWRTHNVVTQLHVLQTSLQIPGNPSCKSSSCNHRELCLPSFGSHTVYICVTSIIQQSQSSSVFGDGENSSTNAASIVFLCMALALIILASSFLIYRRYFTRSRQPDELYTDNLNLDVRQTPLLADQEY